MELILILKGLFLLESKYYLFNHYEYVYACIYKRF